MSKLDQVKALRLAREAGAEAKRKARRGFSPGVSGETVVRGEEFIEKRARAVFPKAVRPAFPVRRMSAAEKASLDVAVPVGRGRGRGRPRGPETVVLPARVPPSLAGRVEAYRSEKGLRSTSEAVRVLLEEALK